MMSRLIDCSKLSPASSDVDTPDNKTMGPATALENYPKTPSRRRDLVPKSTCKPSTRRIRRLNNEKLATENPLFQPWTTDSSKQMVRFTRDVSPRKASSSSRPLRLFSGSRSDENPNQTRSSISASMISKSSSDFDDSSEPDIGDVTLPPSLQLVRNTTELSHRINRLRVPGQQDACDTIVEDGEDASQSLGTDATAFLEQRNGAAEKQELFNTPQGSPQWRDGSCDADDELILADGGIGLPEPPSPTLGPSLRLAEPLSPRDSNKTIRSLKKENAQKCLSLLRNPLALLTDEKENGFLDHMSAEEGASYHTEATETPMPKVVDASPIAHSKPAASPRKIGGRRVWSSSLRQLSSAEQTKEQDVVEGCSDGLGRQVPGIQTEDLKSPTKKKLSSFEGKKRLLAEEFLSQLDSVITDGRIAKLAESTGGVKLLWTKSLNTTAGRANWRKETVRTTEADGTEVNVRHNHHASIELAEKVIDDENRLLNVLAHEFCHLANFMISGTTNNPHGKDFKSWAQKCTVAFRSRGVEVTTKHTYDIDFKYVWQCVDCSSDYKRHSKSIDTEKHRCGGCKGKLVQTKPKPRNAGKPSQYQLFVKEQMRILKQENPGSPQKVIMGMAAERWAKRQRTSVAESEQDVEQVVDKLMGMAL